MEPFWAPILHQAQAAAGQEGITMGYQRISIGFVAAALLALPFQGQTDWVWLGRKNLVWMESGGK